MMDAKDGDTKTLTDRVTQTLTGLMRAPGADFGKGLIEAAQKQNRDNLQGQVVGHVQSLMVSLQKQRDYAASTEANIALLEAKLAAVTAGEFTLSPYGVITFNDPALERAVVAMKECRNCGYSGRPGPDAVYDRNSR